MDYKYLDGRFFVSPLIGCRSNCVYCYLTNELKKPKIINKNKNSIKDIVTSIKGDKRFVAGQNGSIISIGAYCDVFPIDDKECIDYSIDWIIGLLEIGNPIQVISKNILSKDLVKLICESIKYPKQLLYSTTITSFSYWSVLEKNSSSPDERLETLSLFKNYGVDTNVMIKPYLPGLTDSDIEQFKNRLTKDIVDYCVVGDLFLINNKILDILSSIYKHENNQEEINVLNGQVLDCIEDKEFEIVLDNRMECFINRLRESNISVYKKSSCVSANILGVKNVSEYYKDLTSRFCIRCGNCN